jgi:hypothetical protein
MKIRSNFAGPIDRHALGIAPDRRVGFARAAHGAFLSPLDYFIVNLALPAIRSGLRASSAELQLIVSVYSAAFALFLVTGGRLGDLFGRKWIFMLGRRVLWCRQRCARGRRMAGCW